MLTPRQREIYLFLRTYVGERGYPPTVRELCHRFDVNSPNGIVSHLRALEKKGAITRDRAVARGIRVAEEPGEDDVATAGGRPPPRVSLVNGLVLLDLGRRTRLRLSRGEATRLAHQLLAQARGADLPRA